MNSRGWAQLCSELMKVKERHQHKRINLITMKLKIFYSYKKARKNNKVDRAIKLAESIPRNTDPLRHTVPSIETNPYTWVTSPE